MTRFTAKINKKANRVCAAIIMAAIVTIPSVAFALRETCETARRNCYNTWYIPNWGCDNLADACNAR